MICKYTVLCILTAKIMQLETRNGFIPREQFCCLAIFHVFIKVASNVPFVFKLADCTGTNQLRAKLLDGTKTNLEAYLVKGRNKALNTGLRLTTNGFCDQSFRPLLNATLVGPDGSEFVKSVDKSGAAKTGDYIAGRMTPVIEEINEKYQQLRDEQTQQPNMQKLEGVEVVQNRR
jgi:hypothetical protein